MTIPIEKSLEDIRQEMFDRVNEVQAEYAAKGWLPRLMSLAKGVIRGLLELWNWGLYQLYQLLISVLGQAFPSEASGAWLDFHCRQVEVYRKPATRARGAVYFTRSGTSGNVVIPKDSIVKTLPDGTGMVYRYVVTQEAILPDGQTEVAAQVVAEHYGAAANVTAGMIREIATTIAGIDGVENRADWLVSEGSDEEDDASLFERYVLAWQEKNGCTKHAYEAWARSVTGVADARILDQHPRGQGTVDVVITGAAGIPTQQLIDAVSAVIQENAPLNDDAQVKGPVIVPVDIVGELELVSGDPDAALTAAEQRLRALFYGGAAVPGISPLGVGQDAPLDLLRWAAMGVSAARVKKTSWTSPAVDISVPEDGLAVLNSINLTCTWASEE